MTVDGIRLDESARLRLLADDEHSAYDNWREIRVQDYLSPPSRNAMADSQSISTAQGEAVQEPTNASNPDPVRAQKRVREIAGTEVVRV